MRCYNFYVSYFVVNVSVLSVCLFEKGCLAVRPSKTKWHHSFVAFNKDLLMYALEIKSFKAH